MKRIILTLVIGGIVFGGVYLYSNVLVIRQTYNPNIVSASLDKMNQVIDIKSASFEGENTESFKFIQYDRYYIEQRGVWKNGNATATIETITFHALPERLLAEKQAAIKGKTIYFTKEEHYKVN